MKGPRKFCIRFIVSLRSYSKICTKHNFYFYYRRPRSNETNPRYIQGGRMARRLRLFYRDKLINSSKTPNHALRRDTTAYTHIFDT